MMLLTVVIGNVENAVVTERVDAAVEMEWRGMCVSMLIALHVFGEKLSIRVCLPFPPRTKFANYRCCITKYRNSKILFFATDFIAFK
jgi:hypothetical protein